MTYVIAEPCVDVMDRACVEECPVDCIYVGERSLYIHPGECVDCGACEPVCPVEAIYYEDDLPGRWQVYAEDNARFFSRPCSVATAHWAVLEARLSLGTWEWTRHWWRRCLGHRNSAGHERHPGSSGRPVAEPGRPGRSLRFLG
jgi:NAD-dependent dihydropyrimidine dehydrogenase PreA subunit